MSIRKKVFSVCKYVQKEEKRRENVKERKSFKQNKEKNNKAFSNL